MKQFMVLYQAPVSAREMMANLDPEQAKNGMAMWMAWFEKNDDAILEMGTPLGDGKRIDSDGTSEAQRQATGYSIVQADSLDEVTAMLRDHPHFQTPGDVSIEVFEFLPAPGS